MLTFRYISRNFFDVFWGDGWDNCARVKKARDGDYIIVRAYKKPPKDFIKLLKDTKHETI